MMGCACAQDVYQEPNGGDDDEDEKEKLNGKIMEASKCAEILGLGSPEVSYLERRRAYIKAALVMSRTVGVCAPWAERNEMERRGATNFSDVECAFEGLRSSREIPPGFSPDDFLPQLQYSIDGGRSIETAKPSISAMIHADVRRNDSSSGEFFDISVKFSTTRFVLSRSLDDFYALHAKLKRRVPACGRSLPPLPTTAEAKKAAPIIVSSNPKTEKVNKKDESSIFTVFFGNKDESDESIRNAANKSAAVATRKLRAYLAQVIDWFRARRVYDPDVLEFLDLDGDLLLRLHREDMRVVRNIVVSWGGHVAHALPAQWVDNFVQSITPARRSDKTQSNHSAPAPKHLPGPIILRKILQDTHLLKTTPWAVVTKPAWIILSTVYGADTELDIDTLRKLLIDKNLSTAQVGLDSPPTSLLGLPVAAPNQS